jgi:hypothetical protein
MNAEYFAMLWELLKGGLFALTLLTVLDVLFGILVALFIKKDFKWVYLDHFLTSDVLPMFAWVGAVLITTIPAELVPSGILPIVSNTIYVLVFLSILASVLESFTAIGVLKAPLNRIGIGDKFDG